MIACYARVSTSRQKTDSQVFEMKRWLSANGHNEVVWYEDKETGKHIDRESFKRFQRDIFSGKVKTVVFLKLDRLSRRLMDGITILADWCERGVKAVVVIQQIELDGPVGRMIAAVMLGLAEIELEYRRERQEAGIAVAKRRGRYRGRKAGTQKVRPQRARELRRRGLKIAEIVTALGVSRSTVMRY